MLLGEGKRKVGEACWSHAQCLREQPNAHCHELKCTCDSGFHNYHGRCSRNMWEDLGLAQWELVVFALVLTLMAFAVFVGFTYFIISKIIRFRKTSPADNFTPKGSFSSQDKDDKKQSSIDGFTKNIRADGFTKNIRAYETKLTDSSTVESQLVDEEGFRFCNKSMSTVSEIPTEPVRFIRPLDYRSSNSGLGSRQSSRRSSSSSQHYMRPSSRNFRPPLGRAWSQTPSFDENDDWFQPNRNHIRRLGPHSPASMARLPLLLRAATFSESDESP